LTDRPYDPSRDIHRCLNDQAAVMFQIESLEGIRNLDAILTACPDVDAIWLGSLDCRISMNLPGNGGMGGSEPEWQEAVGLFKETMRKHDKPYSGFYMGPPEGVKKGIEGMCMAYIDADVVALGGMYEKLGAMKQAIAQ
jgi:2-keto-3-deoxy-L-rhamnonate aldolase RhmA